MKFLSASEVQEWCSSMGIEAAEPRQARYSSGERYAFRIESRLICSRVLALVSTLFLEGEDETFSGALLWIHGRGAWGDYAENIGEAILGGMRLADGENRPLEESPGHAFESHDLLKTQAYLSLPLLLGWDALLGLQNASYFINVSHDGYLDLECRTETTFRALFQRLQPWNPREIGTH